MPDQPKQFNREEINAAIQEDRETRQDAFAADIRAAIDKACKDYACALDIVTVTHSDGRREMHIAGVPQ